MGRLATLALILLVGLAPLALGSNRPLPWAYNAAGAGLAAILTAGAVWQERRSRISLRLDLIAVPLALWCLALSWAFLQLMPVGMSSLAHPAWGLADVLLGGDLGARVTVNTAATVASIMRFLTYMAIFLSGFVLARDASRAGLLLRGFLAAAMVYAVYGLLRSATGINKILWFDDAAGGGLTASFINRNSAATYFGMAACVSLVYLLRRARHVLVAAEEQGTTRRGFERLIGGVSGRLGLETAGFVLLFAATLLTTSRAGVSSALFAMLLGLVFTRLRASAATSGLTATLMMLIVVMAGVAVLQMSGAAVVERLLETDVGAEGRLPVYADTLVAISDHALMGTGLGTFPDIFPLYRAETLASDTIWDKAHNDYLEVLLGLGIPAGLAIIFGVAILVLRCFRGAFLRRRNSHFAMAGALAGVMVGLHAFFDFSLQIQAVAMSFALVLGVGVAQSVSDRGPS